jgi:predicted metalloprotease with PDZ domain
MLHRFLLFFFFLLITVNLSAQRKEACSAYGWDYDYPKVRYVVDLEYMKEDMLHVDMTIEDVRKNTVIFCMPKIVPGIYGAMDFGRLVENLSAADVQGNILETERIDQNRWKIKGTKGKLLAIHYDVNDEWEEFDESHPEGYLSAASMFRKNEVFVINHNAVFGYLEGYQHKGIRLEINKPAAMTGVTALPKTIVSETQDLYTTGSYRELVDQPVLYARLEVSNFRIGDVSVDIAMYSTSGKSLAPEIMNSIRPLMEHQQAYLGGELPVTQYTFLLYHNPEAQTGNYRWDGLEHSNSTLILMYMAFDPEMIRKNVYGVVSHEFFHTIVPLGIHSREIAEYDFNDPEMSEHLWLYEGLTEYFTIHMPVKEHLITPDAFLESVADKIRGMREFPHVHSLTFLSKHALEYQDQYMDFYGKGALLNLCLDIRLRELSGGTYGVQDLTADLMKEYGPYRSFKDKKLFREIARISHQPEIRKFLQLYAGNNEPLPLGEYFAKVGIRYDDVTDSLSWMEHPTDQQLALRKAWIGN